MSAPVAGWYADPTGSPVLRYWSGTAWTESTQPLPGQAPPASPYGGQYGGPLGPNGSGPAPAPTPSSFLARNKLMLITVAICAVYVLVATESRFVFFGILPVLMTVRSFQAREPLAIVAAAVAVLTIVYSVYQLNH